MFALWRKHDLISLAQGWEAMKEDMAEVSTQASRPFPQQLPFPNIVSVYFASAAKATVDYGDKKMVGPKSQNDFLGRLGHKDRSC